MIFPVKGNVVLVAIFWGIVLLHDVQGKKKCPPKFFIQEQDMCYNLQLDLFKRGDASSNCENLAKGGQLAKIIDSSVLDKVARYVRDFVQKKSKKGYFWLGFHLEPPGALAREGDPRIWIFDYDESKIDQYEFPYWNPYPLDDSLHCATINGSEEFLVHAVDCGSEKIPVICYKKNEPCKHDIKPYFVYEDMCLAVLNAPLEYNKIHAACRDEGIPAPFKDMNMRRKLIGAVKNSFMGGSIYVGLTKDEDTDKWTFSDGTEPTSDMWAPGEPRSYWDCAGLSVQDDDSIRFRSMNCETFASSLCSVYLEPGNEK